MNIFLIKNQFYNNQRIINYVKPCGYDNIVNVIKIKGPRGSRRFNKWMWDNIQTISVSNPKNAVRTVYS